MPTKSTPAAPVAARDTKSTGKSAPTPKRDDVRRSKFRSVRFGKGNIGGIDVDRVRSAGNTGRTVRKGARVLAGVEEMPTHGRIWRAWAWVRGWWRSYLVAMLHIGMLAIVSTRPLYIVIPMYFLVGIVSIYCRKDARQHWWRFPIIVALSYLTYIGPNLIVLLCAEAWAIHQSWVAVTYPTDKRLFPKYQLPKSLQRKPKSKR